MSLELIDRYLEHVRVERRLAARTVELYSIHLATLTEKATAAGVALDKVQTAHVRRWMAQLHSAGRESRGIALVLSCWRSFYRWLGNEGLVGSNPVQDVHAPKAARPLPKALAVDEAVPPSLAARTTRAASVGSPTTAPSSLTVASLSRTRP